MEELYKMNYNKEYYIVTANDFIKGCQLMTLREAQLLFIAISQVVKEDTDFKTFTTTVPELATFMGIDTDSLYRDLPSICKDLLSRTVGIESKVSKRGKKSFDYFQFVNRATYADGTLTIRLSDEIKPYLLDLNAYYTQTKLGVIMSFNSYYSIRLYQYLRACYGEQQKKIMHCCFTIEELRELFQTGKKYSSPKDLIKKTIKAAISEISDSGYVYISNYQENKGSGRGNPLESVSFDVIFFESMDKKTAYLQRLQKNKTVSIEDTVEPLKDIWSEDVAFCSEEEFARLFSDL